MGFFLNPEEVFMTKSGFNLSGTTYLITGGNTFSAKELLREHGAEFNNVLGWHCSHEIKDLPEPFRLVPATFNDFYKKTGSLYQIINNRDNFLNKTENVSWENCPEIGTRIKKMPAILVYKDFYKETSCYFYKFQGEKQSFAWFTNAYKNLALDASLLISGTVSKNFITAEDERITVFKRCYFHNTKGESI